MTSLPTGRETVCARIGHWFTYWQTNGAPVAFCQRCGQTFTITTRLSDKTEPMGDPRLSHQTKAQR